MSSRRSVRQLIVAVLLGVMVGGGLMAITPAGAEVSQSLATSWKKIWKKELKPLADKRYYKKSQSDSKYATKTESAASAAAAQSAANAATDGKLGSYYKKTESDAKYAPYPSMTRGTFWGLGTFGIAVPINWGPAYSAAPTSHVILPATTPPTGCSGTAAAPVAAPGNLCIFVTGTSASGTVGVYKSDGNPGTDPFGANLVVSASANSYLRGSWAAAPLALAPAGGGRVVPSPAGGTTDAFGIVR
ncbi:hypothetical protein J2X46_001475 [Nocardioides sp. BE266]|uniref:hypothetical protein n=1 Tax=Nocardioides sp. BE266 TaxID=2817725 RepID=UPI00285FFC25|nr:hypothetical protein [Nocardioides sp. BE266]MDR7252499.1 hypothetical protein [Nocardioides sp. BE266]